MPSLGFPGGSSGKEPACQFRRRKRNGFDPWVGKNSWRRTWQPTQYFCLDTPMDRGPWRLQSIGWQRVRRDGRDVAHGPFLLTWIHIRLETDESLAKRIFLFLIAGLVVSKPDLVTFLEQMKNPWDVRRLETPAVYTGRGQWMKPTSPQQEQGLVRNSSLSCGLGRSASMEMILEKSGFLSVAVIGGYHLPRSVSLNHSWIHLQWLLFSITVRTETLLLAGDNLHESITIPFRGGQGAPRKTEHFWKTLRRSY